MDRETIAFIARCAFLLNEKREYFTQHEIDSLEACKYEGYTITEAVEEIKHYRYTSRNQDFMEAC